MESATPREETLPAAGTEGTLRRAGTAGWEFSRLARKAWSTGLPDEHATSQTQAGMGKEETIWAAAGVLRRWIEKNGVPRALYTDWKNVYIRASTPAEQLRGEVPVTQFGRMCQKLKIRIIAASSPQAKGRVERNHGTHQESLDQENAAESDR